MGHTNRSTEHQEHKVKTILVVEDDAGIGAFLVEALKMEVSYQALLAIDGHQALELVKTVVPDLFVLDYHLPQMDGLELTDRLQATEALKQIPILLMSASIPKKEREKRQVAFIEKPFDLDTLLEVIATLLAE